MKKLAKNKTHKLKKSLGRRRHFVLAGTAVVLTVAFGLYFVLAGSAATGAIAAEPDTGQRTGPATVVSDGSASGEAAIKFGSAVTPPTPPLPPLPPPAPAPAPYNDFVVNWVVVCKQVKTALEDAIVFPGQTNVGHMHAFGGNLDITPTSTGWSLFKGRTNCLNTRDKSSYWSPTLQKADGTPVIPKDWRLYYRSQATDYRKAQPIPFGLKLVSGDAKATRQQTERSVGFLCIRASDGAVISGHITSVNCGGTNFLRSYIEFPNCWDGRNLDSPDHKSHVTDDRGGVCPPTHPVIIPKLFIEFSYPAGQTTANMPFVGGLTPYGLHGDFINAWDPGEMKFLTEQCINAGRDCADMTDTRRPPGGARELRGTIPIPPENSL